MPRIAASTAFADLRVLDLTRVRAGPTCVKHFADFGADVIKIEAIQGDDLGDSRDGFDFQNLHRNKKAMTLNLKSPEGHAIFMKLAEKAGLVMAGCSRCSKLSINSRACVSKLCSYKSWLSCGSRANASGSPLTAIGQRYAMLTAPKSKIVA